MIFGEPVFYRPQGKPNELPAVLLKQSNNTFSMLVSQPGYTFKELSSVAYWDHTEEKPELTGDPMAPHNNNGTFRRTEFSHLLTSIIDNMGSLPDIAADMVTMKADIDKIKAELKLQKPSK